VFELRLMSVCPSVLPHLHNNHVQTVTFPCISGYWNNVVQSFKLFLPMLSHDNVVSVLRTTSLLQRSRSHWYFEGSHCHSWGL
jgi:hypothetical protein